MPVYEYRCARGHEYETVEGFDAPTEHACPQCGRSAKRQLSAPVVIFKGPGFYSTDSRKGWSLDSAQDRSGDGGSSSDGASEEAERSHDDGNGSKTEAKAGD